MGCTRGTGAEPVGILTGGLGDSGELIQMGRAGRDRESMDHRRGEEGLGKKFMGIGGAY